MQFGEFGYMTTREKPSHHQGEEHTHHRQMFPPAVLLFICWLHSFKGGAGLSSLLSGKSQSGKASWMCPLHGCCLVFLWMPTGRGLSCHADFSPCRCHLSAVLSLKGAGFTFTLSSLKVECHRLEDPAHCSTKFPTLSLHLFLSVHPSFH